MGAARTARKQDNLRKAAPCHLSGTRPPQARQTSHPRHHANAAVPPPPRPSQDQVRICRHAHREAIEQEFLHWRSPESLARAYGILAAPRSTVTSTPPGSTPSAAATPSNRSSSSSSTLQTSCPPPTR